MNKILYDLASPIIGFLPGRVQTNLAEGDEKMAVRASKIGLLTHLAAGGATCLATQITYPSSDPLHIAALVAGTYLASTAVPKILGSYARDQRYKREMPFGDVVLELWDERCQKKRENPN